MGDGEIYTKPFDKQRRTTSWQSKQSSLGAKWCATLSKLRQMWSGFARAVKGKVTPNPPPSGKRIEALSHAFQSNSNLLSTQTTQIQLWKFNTLPSGGKCSTHKLGPHGEGVSWYPADMRWFGYQGAPARARKGTKWTAVNAYLICNLCVRRWQMFKWICITSGHQYMQLKCLKHLNKFEN